MMVIMMILAAIIVGIFIGAVIIATDVDLEEEVIEYFHKSSNGPSGDVLSIEKLNEIKQKGAEELIAKTNDFIQSTLNPELEKAAKHNESSFKFTYNESKKTISGCEVHLDYLIEQIKKVGYTVTIDRSPLETYTIVKIEWGNAGSE